jgi:hypothetical protein
VGLETSVCGICRDMFCQMCSVVSASRPFYYRRFEELIDTPLEAAGVEETLCNANASGRETAWDSRLKAQPFTEWGENGLIAQYQARRSSQSRGATLRLPWASSLQSLRDQPS